MASSDVERPSAARVYDYMLGGQHNSEVDRRLADSVMATSGTTTMAARHNRAFMERAVEFMSVSGITQFLDLGCGIPTSRNVHDIARKHSPRTRVVYVDNDPTAIAVMRHCLVDDDAAVIDADIRRPETVINHSDTVRLIDFSQPIGLLMIAVAHFIDDSSDPWSIVRNYRDRLAPTSYFALSHAAASENQESQQAAAFYGQTPTPVTPRTRTQVAALLQGFHLVDPGLTWASCWRPAHVSQVRDPASCRFYVAVGEVIGG